MKKKILVIVCVIVCIIAIGVFVLAGKGISTSVGLFLRTDNSDMLILDNSPIVMSVRTDNHDMFEKYESGDKIFVLHDGIQETYPGGTGVYFSVKLADGHMSDISETVLRQLYELGWTSAPVRFDTEQESEPAIYSPDLFDIAYVSSYSMFNDEKIKNECINADKMNDDDNYHLPVFRFDTQDDLTAFVDSFDEKFDSGHSDSDDFREKLKDYNDDFFKEKMLFVVYFEPRVSNSGYELYGTYTDGEIFRLEYSLTKSENNVSLAVSTSRISIIGVEKDFVGDCSEFDAVILG